MVDQVSVDLVVGVEIGEPAQREWVPGINHNAAAVQVVARPTSSFIRTDALGCRSLVERFRKRVVKLPLQVGSPAGIIGYLKPVVVGSADVAPRIKRRELVVEEAIGAILAVG